MEDAYIEIVQPRHLRPFIPLAAQELQDNLDRMPFPLAVWYSNEFRYVIRQYKKSWHWYYARVPDLWTYLDSLDHAISVTFRVFSWKIGVDWIARPRHWSGHSFGYIFRAGV